MAGEASGGAAPPPRRILIIDDDEQLRVMLRRMLEYAGYEVHEAGDGDEGMKLVQTAAIDLVITDILMPNREGLETIISLRRALPELPVIAMSGGGWGGPANYLVTANKLGAARTLAKPFSRQEILDVVSDVMKDYGLD